MTNGLKLYRRLFQESRDTNSKTIVRGSLPTTLQYLSERGILKRHSIGEWVEITCPAHKSGTEKNPSLRVSLADGHFKCHACGVKGGDVLALHRLITGATFLDAVRDLGARFHE